MKLPEFVLQIMKHLNSAGFQAFVVGGCVRNHLLGLPIEDWDMCTDALPEQMQTVLADFQIIPTGIQHGTVTALVSGHPVEITTFRTDGSYADSRHPDSVTYVKNLEADLARRDFTVNAMAFHPEKGMIDPFGGQNHLKEKKLCCVGDATTRFSEDALRILRAIRFSAKYELTIAPETALAMHQCKDGLHQIAKERFFAELTKTLLVIKPGKVLRDFPDLLDIWFEIQDFTVLQAQKPLCFARKFEVLDTILPEAPLRLAWLFEGFSDEKISAILQKIKADNKTKSQTLKYARMLKEHPPTSRIEARFFCQKYGKESIPAFLSLLDGQKIAHRLDKLFDEILQKNLCCSIAELSIDGQDLLKKGEDGTPKIGELLEKALHAVICEEIPNEKKAILDYLFL